MNGVLVSAVICGLSAASMIGAACAAVELFAVDGRQFSPTQTAAMFAGGIGVAAGLGAATAAGAIAIGLPWFLGPPTVAAIVTVWCCEDRRRNMANTRRLRQALADPRSG